MNLIVSKSGVWSLFYITLLIFHYVINRMLFYKFYIFKTTSVEVNIVGESEDLQACNQSGSILHNNLENYLMMILCVESHYFCRQEDQMTFVLIVRPV